MPNTVNFKDSATKENLMRSFAGECQARARYEYAANQATKQNCRVLYELFHFTAGQETQHAKVFYDFLRSLAGETLLVQTTYPIDDAPEMEQWLRAAAAHEFEEGNTVYPQYANVASQEGFTDIANAFSMIASIEKVHGDRFTQYADLMKNGFLFAEGPSDPAQDGWMCLNCGHIHYGPQAPGVCPVCKHNQGFFLRTNAVPFS